MLKIQVNIEIKKIIQHRIPSMPRTKPTFPVEESGSLDRAIVPKTIAMIFPMMGRKQKPKIPNIMAIVPLVSVGL